MRPRSAGPGAAEACGRSWRNRGGLSDTQSVNGEPRMLGWICALLSKQTLLRSQSQGKEYPLLSAFSFGSFREKARLDWAQTGVDVLEIW